jgi:transcriptional regulator GlxA family with amidase domain
MAKTQIGARALTSALMKACLVLLIRQFILHPGPRGVWMESLPDPRFSRSIAAVLDRPSGDHTLDGMASTAGMSRSRFAEQFRDAFGMSPMAFVAKTRLHHAAQLLRSTPLPVKVIAGAAGFASRSHFSRAFKEAYGTDPSAFREKHGIGATDPPPADVGFQPN